MITMYAAAKMAGVSHEGIRKQTKKNPPPLFFKKLRDGSFMVDEEHQLFIVYCERIAARKKISSKGDDRFNKLLAAVVAELGERYSLDDDSLSEVLDSIDVRYQK